MVLRQVRATAQRNLQPGPMGLSRKPLRFPSPLPSASLLSQWWNNCKGLDSEFLSASWVRPCCLSSPPRAWHMGWLQEGFVQVQSLECASLIVKGRSSLWPPSPCTLSPPFREDTGSEKRSGQPKVTQPESGRGLTGVSPACPHHATWCRQQGAGPAPHVVKGRGHWPVRPGDRNVGPDTGEETRARAASVAARQLAAGPLRGNTCSGSEGGSFLLHSRLL